MKTLTLAPVLCFCVVQAAFAGHIDWTDWTSATKGADGSATGVMGGVTVTYSGDIAGYQLSPTEASGTQYPYANYWVETGPNPYTGNAVVDNAPTANELIATENSGLKTLTFSEEVLNPVIAIVSQGRSGLPVSYDFAAPFTVLSEGKGFWGDGSYTLEDGDVLVGRELHAVVQFSGSYRTIRWESSPDEYWHGITVGSPASVPEPGAALLLLTGLIALSGSAVLNRKKIAPRRGRCVLQGGVTRLFPRIILSSQASRAV